MYNDGDLQRNNSSQVVHEYALALKHKDVALAGRIFLANPDLRVALNKVKKGFDEQNSKADSQEARDFD